MTDNRIHILWVEDNPELANFYITRMQMEGFVVSHYENGEKALGALAEFTPDLMLIDLMLPGVSGFDILDKVRQMPQMTQTKVIVLSALGRPEDIERATKLGADDFLIKSEVPLDDLVQIVRRHLNLPSAQTANS